METFLLLLHGNATARPDLSPAEMQAMFAKYRAWTETLKKAGHYVGGNKLEDGTARIMRANGGKAHVTDGPFAETKDVIAGYYMIQCANYEEAVAISQECPHLNFGTVEIRRVEVMA